MDVFALERGHRNLGETRLFKGGIQHVSRDYGTITTAGQNQGRNLAAKTKTNALHATVRVYTPYLKHIANLKQEQVK